MKKCSKCGEEKEYNQFYTYEVTVDGLTYHCKRCIATAARERYHQKHPNHKTYKTKYQEGHLER